MIIYGLFIQQDFGAEQLIGIYNDFVMTKETAIKLLLDNPNKNLPGYTYCVYICPVNSNEKTLYWMCFYVNGIVTTHKFYN